MTVCFAVGERMVGHGQPVFIVADVAQAHDGSLGAAHAFIDVVTSAGVDAVKFQTHMAAAESTPDEPFRVPFSRQDASRYDYWKRMEFSPEQWQGLTDHARERGIGFLSSPFSLEAVDLLESIGMPAWKVGSGEVTNTLLLKRLIDSGKPIFLSSGMSSWEELDAAVAMVVDAGVPCMVYQCTTQYPCPPERVGLGMLAELKRRYNLPVGLSDHSGDPCFGIAAAALGAASVEVHIAMHRDCFGPDVPASLVPEDLALMVHGIRAVEASLSHPLDKDADAAAMTDLKKMFGRSLVTRFPVRAGQVVTMEMLTAKKPALGLPPSQADQVVGRRARRDLPVDHFLAWDDLE